MLVGRPVVSAEVIDVVETGTTLRAVVDPPLLVVLFLVTMPVGLVDKATIT